MSDCEEVSQCSSEPSSEHVNRWSGLVGWKWTSHTVQKTKEKLVVKKETHLSYTTPSKSTCKFKPGKLTHLLRLKSYFQQSVPPWVRRVRCLVSRPRHRACHPALLWPQCAVGSDVCPHSAKGLYPLTWKQNNLSPKCKMHFWRKEQNRKINMYKCNFLVRTEQILQGEDLGWWAALLSEIPQLELADRVHCQNLCCPQISHSMNCAAVRILWYHPIKKKKTC